MNNVPLFNNHRTFISNQGVGRELENLDFIQNDYKDDEEERFSFSDSEFDNNMEQDSDEDQQNTKKVTLKSIEPAVNFPFNRYGFDFKSSNPNQNQYENYISKDGFLDEQKSKQKSKQMNQRQFEAQISQQKSKQHRKVYQISSNRHNFESITQQQAITQQDLKHSKDNRKSQLLQKQIQSLQLAKKINELNKINYSRNKTAELTKQAKFKQPTEKELCKILLLTKKLAPNCSINRIFTIFYYSLVLKRSPPSQNQQPESAEDLQQNLTFKKVPLISKYNLVIQYFCKLGYSFEGSRQHFQNEKVFISKDQYKAILLDVMEKVLKNLQEYLSTTLPSFTQPILSQVQEKLAKLHLVKAWDWMPEKQKTCLEEFIRSTYHLKTEVHKINPQSAKRLYQILLEQVIRVGNLNNHQTHSERQVNEKTKTEIQKNIQNQPQFKQNCNSKPFQNKNQSKAISRSNVEQKNIWSEGNLQQIVQLYVRFPKHQTVCELFLQKHPQFQGKVSLDVIKNKLQKVLREAWKLLNSKYPQTYFQLSERKQYQMLQQQPPLPKISDKRLKSILRQAGNIEARVKLCSFYLNLQDVQKQFEAVSSIRECLKLSQQQEKLFELKGRRSKKGDKINVGSTGSEQASGKEFIYGDYDENDEQISDSVDSDIIE